MDCETCEGSGYLVDGLPAQEDWEGAEMCPDCLGTGKREQEPPAAKGDRVMFVILHKRPNDDKWRLWNDTLWQTIDEARSALGYIKSMSGVYNHDFMLCELKILATLKVNPHQQRKEIG